MPWKLKPSPTLFVNRLVKKYSTVFSANQSLYFRFYQKADSSSSRKLFKFTLIHLPLIMTLMFVSKKATTKDKKDPKWNGSKPLLLKKRFILKYTPANRHHFDLIYSRQNVTSSLRIFVFQLFIPRGRTPPAASWTACRAPSQRCRRSGRRSARLEEKERSHFKRKK